MSSIEIHFEGPDGSEYTISMDDYLDYTLLANGEALIDRAVESLKRAACITSQ